MNKIASLTCILLSAALLSACSYFDTGEDVDLSTAQGPQVVDLATGEEMTAQPLAPIEYKDVADAIHSSTEGSVQIFPFEDEMPIATTSPGDIVVEPVQAVPLSGPLSLGAPTYAPPLNAYPGVEVFPLDGDMASLVNPRLVPSTLTPLPTPERKPDFVAISRPDGSPAMIFFEHDAVAIRPEDRIVLKNMAGSYNASMGQGDISVVGHASVQSSVADPVQRKIINLKISMDRAFSVARALIESGIPPERLETRAYGETRPPVASDQPLEVASRRVEVYGVSVQ